MLRESLLLSREKFLWPILVFFVLSSIPVSFAAIYFEEDFTYGGIYWKDNTGEAFHFSATKSVGLISEVSGGEGEYYVSRTVNISGARGLHLELDYRADAKDWTYARGRVDLVDPKTSALLDSRILCQGNVRDPGWHHEIFDISTVVGGVSEIEVRMVVSDEWDKNFNQDFWFDDILIWGMPHVFGIPDVSFEQGGRSRRIDLDEFVTDTSTPKSEICWSITDNTYVQFWVDDETHIAHFYSDPSWAGFERITLIARSPDGREGSQVVVVTVTPKDDEKDIAFSTDYLVDFFDTPKLWDDHTSPGHQFDSRGNVGHIRETQGHGGTAYISRAVNVFGIKHPRIELNFRASSLAPEYTNAWIDFVKPHTSLSLGSIQLWEKNPTKDTGWHSFSSGISDILQNISVVEVRLGLDDAWRKYNGQEFWFDNLVIWGEPRVRGIPDVRFNRTGKSEIIDLDDFLTAEPREDLVWSLHGNEHVYLELLNESLARFHADSDWYGTETVTVVATDPEGHKGFDTIQVTVNPLSVKVIVGSSPKVSSLTVDGEKLITSSQPRAFNWTEGTEHQLIVSAIEITKGSTRYTFAGWNDGSIEEYRTITAIEGLELYANFNTWYYLDISAEPGNEELAENRSCWLSGGSKITVSAPPIIGRYAFDHWVLDGQIIPTRFFTLTMNIPHEAIAHYEQFIFVVSIDSKPKVSTLIVDDETLTPQLQPGTFELMGGETHTILIPETIIIMESTMYNFTCWNDGNTSATRTIVPDSNMSFVAFFETKHLLTIETDPEGLVDIEGGDWYKEGTTAQLYAPYVQGHKFERWSVVGLTYNMSVISVQMDSPKFAVAYYLSTIPVLSCPSSARTEDYYLITWERVVDARYYQLQEDPSPDFSSQRLVYNGSARSASITHTQVGVYYYRLRALTESGWSEWSNTGTVEITKPSGIPIPIPASPKNIVIWIVLPLLVIGGFIVVWRLRKRKTPPMKTSTNIECSYDSRDGAWTPASNTRSLPWSRIAIIMFVILACVISVYALTRFLDGWKEVKIPKGGTELVDIKRFGNFEMRSQTVQPMGSYVTISSKTHGKREVSLANPGCFDGIVRGKVLVFQWVDSDVDMIYLRYKTMSNEEFETYGKEE